MDFDHIHVAGFDLGWQGLHAFLPFLTIGLILLIAGLMMQNNYAALIGILLLVVAAIKTKTPFKFKSKKQE